MGGEGNGGLHACTIEELLYSTSVQE